jgi:hypothetical protein
MHAHRLLAGVLASAAIAGALAFTAASAESAQAKAPALITAHNVQSARCMRGARGTVRAQVKGWMRVVNYDGVLKGDWADHMEAKIRLESTTPGWQYTRVWKHSTTAYLTQNRTHTYNWDLTSDNLSDRADWRVHVKLIWHRPAPITNVTKDVYLPFNASCSGITSISA